MKKRLLSLLLCLVAVLTLLPLPALADGGHSHCICGGDVTAGDHTGHTDVTYQPWNGTSGITYANGAAYVYLTGNATLSGHLTVDGKTLYLCLNGKTLASNGTAKIQVKNGGRLVLCDCRGGGTFKGACAAGNVDLPVAAHIDGAAAGIVAVHGRCIAGDGAAGHIDGPAGGGEERAAVLGGVILDGAAVHIESAAGGVRHVCIEFPENGTAVVLAVVAGDLAAVHIEYALLVIQSDGSAAAFAGDFAAGELAAEHIQRAGIKVNAGTAPDTLRRALKGASTLTVAENKSTAVFDLNLGCAVAGKGLAVQAQI